MTERLARLVHNREGGIMLVEGEPGMGKTRLLEELEHESMAQQPPAEAGPSAASSAADLPAELPAIRKMCNIFVANGDLANKSKVLTCCVCCAKSLLMTTCLHDNRVSIFTLAFL